MVAWKHGISPLACWKLEEKFHISARLCIILSVYFFSLFDHLLKKGCALSIRHHHRHHHHLTSFLSIFNTLDYLAFFLSSVNDECPRSDGSANCIHSSSPLSQALLNGKQGNEQYGPAQKRRLERWTRITSQWQFDCPQEESQAPQCLCWCTGEQSVIEKKSEEKVLLVLSNCLRRLKHF